MIRTIAFAAIAAALAAPAQAQVTTRTRASTVSTQVPIGDECFAMKAYGAGLAEIAMSQLAMQRSSNADVKKFSEQMIADHTKVNHEIVVIARAKGIALPAAVDPIHAVVARRLAALSGSDFDKEYMKQQIGAHADALHIFGHEAHKGEDAELKTLAHKTLPALHMHTKLAFEVAGERAEYEKHEKIMKYAKEVMSR